MEGSNDDVGGIPKLAMAAADFGAESREAAEKTGSGEHANGNVLPANRI
jgi:hypothetical protein